MAIPRLAMRTQARCLIAGIFGPLCTLANHAAAQRLELPATAPVDQPTVVRVRGLAPGTRVVLRLTAVDGDGQRWVGSATFRADATGTIDTSRDSSLAGAYEGVAAGSLFNTMHAAGDSARRRRFTTRGVERVLTTVALEGLSGGVLDSAVVERFFVGPGVRDTLISENGLRARLFRPSRTSAPAVVVLGGSEGGYPDDVAALLATNGLVALSLAYFGVNGLPPELAEIPFEYFERALAWLRAQPGVAADRIGLLGTSKGAEAALLLASRLPDLRAVVAYAPSSVAWSCTCSDGSRPSWTLGRLPVAFVPRASDPSYRPAPGEPVRPSVNYLYRLARAPAVAAIPIERIKGPVLLIAGEDDQLWPSAVMARAVMQRRTPLGGHPDDLLLTYGGAGHLIGKTYLPAGATLIANGRLDTGGSPAANARAQADSWPRVLAFLAKALGR